MEVTRIEAAKSGKSKIFFDTGESCMLYAREISRAGLAEHAQISGDTWQMICRDILLPRAKKRLLYLLERMDRTEYQLRQKLTADGYPEEVTEAAICYVSAYHYIDDMRYACSYIRMHEQTKSRRQMLEALRQKGIRREVAEQAMEESYTGSSDELIRRLLLKKHYDPERMDQKEKNKIFQSLMRKGFAAEEIRRAMRAYDEDAGLFD